MPNHVKTVIKFKGLKSAKDKEYIKAMIATPLREGDYLFSPDHPESNWIMDFDKIIPEPRLESECPKDCIVTKDSHVQEDKERPWFNWYEWHCKYWGTKWGAYDGYIEEGKSYLTFVFSTAWSLALPIVNKLPNLGYNFEVKFADEDWGSNCGKLIYDVNSCDWEEFYESDFPNPQRFARNLWDRY